MKNLTGARGHCWATLQKVLQNFKFITKFYYVFDCSGRLGFLVPGGPMIII